VLDAERADPNERALARRVLGQEKTKDLGDAWLRGEREISSPIYSSGRLRPSQQTKDFG